MPGASTAAGAGPKPGQDCALCPRLKAFREDWRRRQPAWFNAPVPAFGPASARLLVVGLAPGLQGANRTGRPFTGDYAGDLLYATLAQFGFTRGTYRADPTDGLELIDARIANAVSCVPPENKPLPAEINTCRRFLSATLSEMPKLSAILTLGRVAHESAVVALGQKRSAVPFAHGAASDIGKIRLFTSYHCSRYNTNTGVLTPAMFEAVLAAVRAHLDAV